MLLNESLSGIEQGVLSGVVRSSLFAFGVFFVVSFLVLLLVALVLHANKRKRSIVPVLVIYLVFVLVVLVLFWLNPGWLANLLFGVVS